MVIRYRPICVAIWDDARFRVLPDDAKMLFLHLLTCPGSTTIPGVVRVGLGGLLDGLNWDRLHRLKAALKALEPSMLQFDTEARLVWIPKALNPEKYYKPQSPNVVLSWRKVLDEIPECPLKADIYPALANYIKAFGKGFTKAFGRAFRKAPYLLSLISSSSSDLSSSSEGEMQEGEGGTLSLPEEQACSTDAHVTVALMHYQGHHPRARPGDKDRKLIRARLKEGYSPADLCRAIDGNHVRPWNVQKNLHKLSLIMRDSGQVTMYLEALEAKPKIQQDAKADATDAAMAQWRQIRRNDDAEKGSIQPRPTDACQDLPV